MSDGKPSLTYKAKETLVSVSLLSLGAAFELVSKYDGELKAELAGWEDGWIFSLGVWPNGPSITMKKEGDRLVYVGKGILNNPKLIIYFKNLDSAILPFTGQMGAHTAFVQHRAILHGNIKDAMQVNRAMAIVQKYLMPGLMFKTIFKRKPKMGAKQLAIKGAVYGLLGVQLARNAGK